MSTGFGLIFWNVEIVKHIKMKDVFRRGHSIVLGIKDYFHLRHTRLD